MARIARSGAAGVIAAGLWLGSSVEAAAQAEPHPALDPYPGATITGRDEEGFAAYPVVMGLNPDGRTDADSFETLSVEGTVFKLDLQNPAGKSPLEIITNYRDALEAAGYTVHFSCGAAECGPSFATSRWGRVTGMSAYSPKMQYLSASHDADGQILYVALMVSDTRHDMDIVEVAEMERGLVTAQVMREGLMTGGRVILDGLYFDTDKAVLKPESAEALTIISEFLKENDTLNVFIVGHTDMTGGFDHNMALSKSRAAAVVKALTEDYGIDAERLSAHGVGPLSPARSNSGQAGRADNRRVEMVER